MIPKGGQSYRLNRAKGQLGPKCHQMCCLWWMWCIYVLYNVNYAKPEQTKIEFKLSFTRNSLTARFSLAL